MPKKRKNLEKHFEKLKPQLAEELKKKLEPIFAPWVEKIAPGLKLFIEMLAQAKIEHREAAAFYRDWMGKEPIPQREFLDWFFQEKYDTTLTELVEHPPEVRVQDIEAAGHWLVSEIKKNQPQQLPKGQKPAPQAFGSAKFTMRKIAILHRYLGLEITVGNRNEIALSYGYSSATSGEKLYNDFNALRRPTDRAGKHKFAIRDIEAILLLLRKKYPGNKKAIAMAEDELNLAKVNNTK